MNSSNLSKSIFFIQARKLQETLRDIEMLCECHYAVIWPGAVVTAWLAIKGKKGVASDSRMLIMLLWTKEKVLNNKLTHICFIIVASKCHRAAFKSDSSKEAGAHGLQMWTSLLFNMKPYLNVSIF